MLSGRGKGARTRTVLALGGAAVLLGTGCTAGAPGVASSVDPERTQTRIDTLTDKAEVAIAEHRGKAAVRYAEQAVALAPADPRYRALLGHAYLQAGRFRSAAQAAGDALALNPRDPRAALDLALAQTALGDWTAARATLATYAEILKPADRGLALALAGDPVGGAVLIGQEARGAAASATARQNLALALALAGHWPDARAVAAVDLAPDEVERRMAQWLQFVRPTTSSEQVASLLGTKAVADAGQPVALALVQPAVSVAVAEAHVEVPVPPAAEPAEPAVGGVRFAARQEIVQPIAARVVVREAAPRAEPRGVRVAASVTAGRYYVQLGAHESAAAAQGAWNSARHRHHDLASLTPYAGETRARGGSFYRLSVGGFARPEAMALCARLRSEGGSCFVREQAGERVADWAAPKRQVAAR
ncbi:SPOR domain-containing protein [Sphingomonas sp. PL-96]|uniref:SPOR domain-containing protein n=1 Tax=Sphingomonas sp. PL-96 TaxID=2887201 RepID=UPI001E376FC5|nr:SPOR domain-containing protein [Sphingomonas sp. PL-96]MCC2976418.1 SPOR domain-containing protein [Sphingomonas sp. PL-96]